ncbi:hypothetical protein SBA2_30115 [Acidobacteriia bacterium SbA2]|nr:hypothetical protein SBA2_30115 [Acidobacteriia bacterium SbA2]
MGNRKSGVRSQKSKVVKMCLEAVSRPPGTGGLPIITQDPRPLLEGSAPQGLYMSSRGQRPISADLRCKDFESRGAAPESSPRREPWDGMWR